MPLSRSCPTSNMPRRGWRKRKQILYLLGPVGGGKSSLAERLKQLMERVSFYAIQGSPVFESPLGLFNPDEDGQILEDDYGIPRRYLRHIMSPWAAKRLQEYNGDITKFRSGQAAALGLASNRRGQDRAGR
jgi:serine protein kinase